jgi:hypothetical protein
MGFLIDSGWLQVIVGVIAIFLTLFIYRLTKKKKSLSYEILSVSPLISISDEIKGSLQVLFNGKAVDNVHLLLIKFINDGNIPVAASDYERPLSLKLEGNSDILSAEFVESTPTNLNPSLKINDKVVVFDPTLMNAGDSFTAKVLVGEYSGKFDVDARVMGVKVVRAVSKNDRMAIANKLSIFGGITGIVALLTLVYISSRPIQSPPHILYIKVPEEIISGDKDIIIRSLVFPADERMKYEWSAERGMIISATQDDEANYHPLPYSSGPDTITLKVTDGNGRTDTKSVTLLIAPPTPTPTPIKPLSSSPPKHPIRPPSNSSSKQPPP